jgi:hypothetical protein
MQVAASSLSMLQKCTLREFDLAKTSFGSPECDNIIERRHGNLDDLLLLAWPVFP